MSEAKFKPGQAVTVGNGAIVGIVERVIFARCQIKPMYLVEWWRDGDLCGREFHEDDVSEATP